MDSGAPRFAVLDYQTYQSMKNPNTAARQIKRILVTGGAGYIGSVAVRVLQQKGYEVIVYDNLTTGKLERLKNCKFVEADLGDREALEKVFREEQIDAVMHFAASIEVEESVVNPAKYYQNNVVNGLNLLDTMAAHNVTRMVFSSSAAVYGEPNEQVITEAAACRPTNPYGETKLMFEEFLKSYAEAYGINSVSLRYFNAAGAWMQEGLGYSINGKSSHLVPRVMDVAVGRTPEIRVFGQDYPTPDGTCIRDYIHVLDLAEAHILALEKLENTSGAHVYNVGTGLGYSVLEVIDEAVEITGRMVPMKSAPRRAGDPAKLVADSGRLQREFAWQPTHDLRSILESSWQWHQTGRPV